MTRTQLCRLAAATLVLCSASAFAGAQVTAAPATVKVRPTEPVPPKAPPALMAARNEFVSFQVVVKADADGASDVKATFAGLTGPGEISADNVQLYRQAYLNLTQRSFPTAPLGRYPDPLVPDVDETDRQKRNAFPFSIPANESRAIWVDVLIPTGTPPGGYTGEVNVTYAGGSAQVPVRLNVLNAQLPSTSSVDTAFLFHRNLACSVHTGDSECGGEEQSFQLRDRYQTLALDHRITLSNTLTFPSSGDWKTFVQRYSRWLDGKLPTRLPGAKMTTAQYHGKREAAPLQAFEQHMEANGWLDRAYDYTGDEPPWGISFEEAKQRAQLVKQAAPKLRTLLTTTAQSADEHGLTQYLDLIVPVVNHVDGTESPYIGNQRASYNPFLTDPANSYWIYQSCMSHGCAYGSNAPENTLGSGWPSYMVDASAARNRAMQWVVFLQDASGELYYETALALDTAWESVFRFNGNGDGTLFYPGTPARIGGTTHVPLPSLRLKHIRQGMQDYEWLKLVSDAGDPAFAKQVAQSLIPSAHQVGDDGAAFDAARLQLISRWQELQPQAPAQPQEPIAQPEPVEPGEPREPLPPGGSAEPVVTEPGEGPPEFGTKRPGVIVGRFGCAAAGPQLLGLMGLAGLAILLRRRRGARS